MSNSYSSSCIKAYISDRNFSKINFLNSLQNLLKADSLFEIVPLQSVWLLRHYSQINKLK